VYGSPFVEALEADGVAMQQEAGNVGPELRHYVADGLVTFVIEMIVKHLYYIKDGRVRNTLKNVRRAKSPTHPHNTSLPLPPFKIWPASDQRFQAGAGGVGPHANSKIWFQEHYAAVEAQEKESRAANPGYDAAVLALFKQSDALMGQRRSASDPVAGNAAADSDSDDGSWNKSGND
jgi:hypothetical protein